MIKTSRTPVSASYLVSVEQDSVARFWVRWDEGAKWASFEARGNAHIDHTDLEEFCRTYLRLRREEKREPCSDALSELRATLEEMKVQPNRQDPHNYERQAGHYDMLKAVLLELDAVREKYEPDLPT